MLSRERKSWDTERKTPNIGSTLIDITPEDFDRLAKTSLAFIDMVLKLEPKCPTYDEATESIMQDTHEDFFEDIPATGLNQRRIGPASDLRVNEVFAEADVSAVGNADEALHEEQDEMVVVMRTPKPTLLEANFGTMERPLRADLNSKDTVKQLADYAVETLKLLNEAELDNNDAWSKITPISDDLGIILAGDGSPTYALTCLKKLDKTYKNVFASFGGFHVMLESIKMKNSLFSAVYLDHMYTGWRKSEMQRQWVMKPGDPNQFEGENIFVVIAFYLVAIRALKRSREEAGLPIELSARDVLNFVLTKAKNSPLLMGVLTDIRFCEIIYMLQQAEEGKDLGSFLSAVKLCGPLLTATHAIKYVSMLSDFVVEWHCKSEADIALFAEFVFTRKTPSGKNIFCDRFVEWIVEDMRFYLGKFATTKDHAETVERVAMNLNNRVSAKTTLGRGGIKTEAQATKKLDIPAGVTMRVSKVFREAFVCFTDISPERVAIYSDQGVHSLAAIFLHHVLSPPPRVHYLFVAHRYIM